MVLKKIESSKPTKNNKSDTDSMSTKSISSTASASYSNPNIDDIFPINHSCEPNLGFKNLNLVAIKKIKKNETLTIEYGFYRDEKMVEF